MKHDLLLIGGSGFVGKAISQQLQRKGYSVLIPSRRYSAMRDLRLLPSVTLVEADVNQPGTISRLCEDLKPQGAVINLVGVLQDRNAKPYGPGFRSAHVELPRLIIEAMKARQLKRYIHMSALGADSNGPSMYQRSKGDGENSVRASGLDWTIFRPSVIFGEEDQFINTFANLAKIFPIIPLAFANAQFQPVAVRDVAAAFVMALDNPDTIGETYDLVGPQVFTMKQLVEIAAQKARKSPMIFSLPNWVGYLQALAFEWSPGPTLMSRDNIASMSIPNVLPAGGRDALIEDFGISKQRIESLLV